MRQVIRYIAASQAPPSLRSAFPETKTLKQIASVCVCVCVCPSISLYDILSQVVTIYTTRRGRYKCSVLVLLNGTSLPWVLQSFTRLAPCLSGYLHCPPVTKTQLTAPPSLFQRPYLPGSTGDLAVLSAHIYGNEVSHRSQIYP